MAGRTIRVTEHGRPIALIIPTHRPTRLEKLQAEGRVVPGRRRQQPPPEPIETAGTVSDLIDDQRQ